MPGKLLLIDGQSFCYRAFYAIRELANSSGEPTNAIYGFITMMKKLLEKTKPEYVAVCFDRKEPTFRHTRYEDYKAHRKPMPDLLIQQIPHIKEVVKAYRITAFELAGYEADDLIGTLAKKGEKAGLDVIIATNDKDALQLVNNRIHIFNPSKEEMLDTDKVKERFGGLGPGQVVEVMALMGDSSDNIPGVPGIGEKTAVDLIREFGSVQDLFSHLSDVKSKSRQQSLKENKQVAMLSRDLATIDCQAPVEFDLDELKLKEADQAKLEELFKRFEFRSLMKELTPSADSGEEKRRYHTVGDDEEFQTLLKKLSKADAFALDTETTSEDPMRAHLVGISISLKPFEAYYIPLSSSKHKGVGLKTDRVLKELKPILEDAKVEKFGQNIKYEIIVFARHGVTLRGIAFDTMIASYLINPSKFNHNLDDISFDYLGVRKIPITDLIGTGKNRITMDQAPLSAVSQYACEDADCVWRLVEPLKKLLHVHKLEKVFYEIEMPLVDVLATMEQDGVALDLDFLKELSKQAEHDLAALTKKIYKEAGEEFNINSTKQLADILFVKLKLPHFKQTKTGYSTDTSVLEKLALSYELPKMLLEYREKSKLKSTYLDAFPELIHPETGFIHTSFNQTVTSTGRLSSSDPNLQNIPIRTETGRQIRRAFVPRAKSRKIVSADYSQVELRILAHFSGDPNLTKAFKNNRDIHAFTAALLRGIDEKDVTREMRNAAKTINFGIVYGMSAFGLAQELKISVTEAQTFIEQYFARYPKVKAYLDSQKAEAHQKGFLTTFVGRRSYFPEINSSNPNIRQFAERAAINAPIQGSAADLIKLAMIDIQKNLEKKKMESRMVIQVHDELVFDVPKKELDELQDFVKTAMEGAAEFDVPLKVDVTVGDNWFKA